jgi:hypothetical protein
LKSFPKNSVDEFQSSIHSEILERLSRFFFSLPCAFEQEQQLFLSEAKFQVERIPRVLRYMIDIDGSEVVVDVQNAASDGLKGKQSHRKKPRKMEKQQQQDLARLGIADPKSKAEASINISVLLETLEGTFSVCLIPIATHRINLTELQRYLELLREPEIYSKAQSVSVGLAFPDTSNHEEGNGKSANITPMAACVNILYLVL